MKKQTSIALLLGVLGVAATTTAIVGFNGAPAAELLRATDPVHPEHVVEITRFYATHAYRSDDYDKDFLIGELDNPGSYFLMNPVFDSSHYNSDGHLIDATCYESSDNFFLGVRGASADKHYYLTPEDRASDTNRLNIVRFYKLKKIELFMDKTLNQVEFDVSKIGSNPYVTCTKTGDEDNDIYTIVDSYDEGFAGHFDSYYFWLSAGYSGKRFVLNKIILTYDC